MVLLYYQKWTLSWKEFVLIVASGPKYGYRSIFSICIIGTLLNVDPAGIPPKVCGVVAKFVKVGKDPPEKLALFTSTYPELVLTTKRSLNTACAGEATIAESSLTLGKLSYLLTLYQYFPLVM